MHRPLRAINYSTAVRGEKLTDKRIAHYARLGYYGEEARQRQLERDKRAKLIRSHKRSKGKSSSPAEPDLAPLKKLLAETLLKQQEESLEDAIPDEAFEAFDLGEEE